MTVTNIAPLDRGLKRPGCNTVPCGHPQGHKHCPA